MCIRDRYYIEDFSQIFAPYFTRERWLNVKEPRDVSPEIERACLRLRRVFSELSVLFPDTKRNILKKASFFKASGLDVDMERILARKSHVFEKAEFTRNNLLLCILKAILKLFVENLRKITFDRNGYQQIQVDIYFLIQLFYETVYLEDESIIIGFYYEIISSATDRSTDPSNLEQTTVETISSIKRSKLKLQNQKLLVVK
eukprot:TRINITY_DN9567_c0_g1_i2.p1 TRINITY_DN9567_c0_g1~~TRINITY_DN9567_c0_g1_i2.p1  ORF type:complete len:236 (+),score=43.82 TRINITY_DN9567_c0_g1_i2:108-710(+)